ncbi:MAG: hypothetical protein VYC39_18555 [Myxococcota bacterium]|nr:hypothetical protein [Myxococcota bacterium]
MKPIYLALPFALGAAISCSESQKNDDSNQVSNVDAGQGDSGVSTCASELPFGEIVDIDTTVDSRTQIHASAAFTGSYVWVAYNRPRSDSKFDVYASAFNCDGSKLFEALKISQSSTRNDIEPQVTVVADRVIVVWQSDNSMGPNNLDIWYRMFEFDGTPITDEQRLEMTRKGVQESGNAWMPAVCAMSDHFVVSGSWGHSETPQFAVFAQRISLDGKLIGEAMDGALQPQFSQVFSSVGCRDDEGIELAWVNSTTAIDEIVTANFVKGSTVAQSSRILATGDNASITLSPNGRFIAFAHEQNGETDVTLLDSEDPQNEISTGSRGRIDFGPVISQQGLIHYRNVRGLNNQVVFARFETDPLSLSDTVTLNSDSAPPYSPVLIDLPGGMFAAWSEGANPNFVIKGQFIAK